MIASYQNIVKRTATHFEGVKRMVETSEGFKLKGDRLMKYEDKRRDWPSLQDVLQIDADGRARIVWFSTISKGWLEHESVDVLKSTRVDEPNMCIRSSKPNKKHYIRHNSNTSHVGRIPYPEKPAHLT